jgi:hypothetical protein
MPCLYGPEQPPHHQSKHQLLLPTISWKALLDYLQRHHKWTSQTVQKVNLEALQAARKRCQPHKARFVTTASMAISLPDPNAMSLDQLLMTTAPSANNQRHKTNSSSVLNNNSGKRNFLHY